MLFLVKYNLNLKEFFMSFVFYSLNDFLRIRHQEKVAKLSIDGGFTCPNRDGKVAFGGCIFCSSHGSGDFTSNGLSITKQLNDQIDLLCAKWPNVQKYIAYFQSYSNTYAPLDKLIPKYEAALAHQKVVGLAIATRPDCLEPDVISYLTTLHMRTHLWVELGLQTIHEKTNKLINRGHTLSCFEQAVYALSEKGIEVVAHMILGLPGESAQDMLATAKYLSKLPLQGIKIHMLHVVDNAPLYQMYQQNPFYLLGEMEYIALVSQILAMMPPHFVIHRVTGDPDKKHLIAPTWTLNKRHVLNTFTHYLKENKIFQGMDYTT